MPSTTINRYGVPLALLLLLGISGGVLVGSQRFLADTAAVQRSHRVIAEIDGLQLNLADCDASLRGFLLLETHEHLVDFQQCQRALPPRLQQLATLLQDNPAQQQRLQEVRVQIETRMRDSARAVARFQGKGAGMVKLDPERARHGRALSQAIRRNTDTMVRSERAALAGSARSTAANADLLRRLAVVGIPAVCALTLVLYLLLRREIGRRSQAEQRGHQTNALLVGTVQQMQRTEQDLRTLNRCSRGLQSCMQADEAVEVARQALERLLGDAGCSVYCTDAAGEQAVCVAHWGEDAVCAPTLSLGGCEGLRSRATQIQRPGAAPACAHAGAARHGTCVPMVVQGEPLGLIHLSSRDPTVLERLPLVEVVAEQLAMALHNLQLRQRLRMQSIRDPLTGLYNRRYLEESLLRELARCERREQPLALMMLDLDHFKALNDRLGHAGGDALLAAFGQLLAGLVRPEDIACRYGGEEFTVILPGAAADVAQRRAEQIRAAVADLQVQHQGQVLPPVTVSIGVAAYPDHGGSTEELLRCADAALYRGKRSGRNRVAAAGDVPLRVVEA
ncbi:GGDEF domain-containing protein [Xanthomonas sp. CFBP 8445]|uniref:GGDEF domain-containing protein n=1 Tax=Xanthomonas sp. CFBP 8445 TaxID=2971236 RepID=UPI0021E08BEB|nr:GGDEF domain-containing protein [Xanthomonas sp. CFBP 8445]UYC11945.1 GGDEF domain-containing protein [Xanthomonas sp. CFBP 8445]